VQGECHWPYYRSCYREQGLYVFTIKASIGRFACRALRVSLIGFPDVLLPGILVPRGSIPGYSFPRCSVPRRSIPRCCIPGRSIPGSSFVGVLFLCPRS
jgi:hypothetical protein